jgi:microcystin degradation protein MlrC
MNRDAPKRCVVAMMQHETNTFSPLPTPLGAFSGGLGCTAPPAGAGAIERYGAADFAFAAMIDAARAYGAEVSVPIAAYAEPSGRVSDDAFEAIAAAVCSDVARGCDAVLLDLHGAMVTESYDDGEGELLKRIRQIDPGVPIAVALDFHTNLTREMAAHATVIDAYRTYPHVDMYQTGKRAAGTLFRVMAEKTATQICWRTLPMLAHMIRQTPARQPMKDIMNLAIEAADSGEVLNASVLGGFPLSDVPFASLGVLVVERAGAPRGARLVDEMTRLAWQRRADFVFTPEPLKRSIQHARQLAGFPIVIADHGDNCGAGGSADDLTVLGEMLKQGMSDIAAGPIWDPEAVAQMVEAGEGAHITLDVGGKTAAPSIGQIGRSLRLRGVVAKITDGRFTITGPMQTGLIVDLGRTVVLKTPAVDALVSEQRWEPYDCGCFTHAGIDPARKRYLLLKSRQHFRAGFEDLAKHIVLAAGPGVCSSNYAQFPFENLARPVYPIDPDTPDPPRGCHVEITPAD